MPSHWTLPSARARGVARRLILDVLPGLDPDAAFPVPAGLAGGRGHHCGHVGFLVFPQDQRHEAGGVTLECIGADAEQRMAAIAQIRKGEAAIRMHDELIHQPRRVGDDGVKPLLRGQQRPRQRLALAQVLADGDVDGSCGIGSIQPQRHRIGRAVAPHVGGLEPDLAAGAIVERLQQAAVIVQWDAAGDVRQRQRHAGIVVELQIAARRAIEFDHLQRIAGSDINLAWSPVQDRREPVCMHHEWIRLFGS